MNSKRELTLAAIFLALGPTFSTFATDPDPPAIDSVKASGTTRTLRFAPYPGAQTYTFYTASNAAGPYATTTNFQLSPYITGYTTNIITNTVDRKSVV